jgi:hypothetical protein
LAFKLTNAQCIPTAEKNSDQLASGAVARSNRMLWQSGRGNVEHAWFVYANKSANYQKYYIGRLKYIATEMFFQCSKVKNSF